MGDIVIWELSTRERLAQRNFKVWDQGSCSMPLQVCCQVLDELYGTYCPS